ncbi:MAG: tRNA (guanosine(46)-N7)-methyltransferase TrmB [Verrucomicrobiaceae bacterium]|nr:tRNA (guanosine(46)-N7)-methyltransferase TrmB [Verrucomicrobiaceae bacterium]
MSVFVPADYFRELRREEIFPDATRPLEIDLGSGDGTFLVEMARQHPGRDFLGIERMSGRVEKTARRIRRAALPNVKILQLESAYSVGWLLPSAGVSRLHLLCPDPWPKKRHHKNRLVNNAEFLGGLERILVPGGEFLLKTDHPEYFSDAQASLASRLVFRSLEWPEDAFCYPQTDFEKHWLALGLTIHRARWRRT